MTAIPDTVTTAEWQSTACILCECNCGIEVRLGGEDGRRFERIRGDKAHPASKGYTCEKALRLDHYQNGRSGRILSPAAAPAGRHASRRSTGTPPSPRSPSASAAQAGGGPESAASRSSITAAAGRGTTSAAATGTPCCGPWAAASAPAPWPRRRPGEFWVNHQMLGAMVRADFEHAEVAVFVGKNPWQSHSIPHARTTLKEIARDPGRSLVVIDPRRTETAELADFHLQVRPGTDAWLLAALAGVIVQEGLVAHAWLAEHATDVDETLEALATVPVAEYCARSGVAEELVRAAARRIAGATGGVAVFEDLGVQMNRHSTLVSLAGEAASGC